MVLNLAMQSLTLFSAFPQMVTCKPEQKRQPTSFMLVSRALLGRAVGGSPQLGKGGPETERDSSATWPCEVCNFPENLNRTDGILQQYA